MINTDKIKKYLRQELSHKRYKHSIEVSKTAVDLASKYRCDLHKAEIAGLIHDCAREMPVEIQLQYIEKLGIKLDDITLKSKELLHGISGVYVCKELFQIDDSEILSAVRYHTTGKVDMCILEKVIFLADYIEPLRSFQGVEEIRKYAFSDLDKAIITAMDKSLQYIISKNKLIHPDTVLARNHIVLAGSKYL